MRSKRRLLGRNDDNSGYLLSPFVNNIRERMEGEAYPKAQTFPVDRHGRPSLRREKLTQVCDPGGQGNRIPRLVGFAWVNLTSGLTQRLVSKRLPDILLCYDIGPLDLSAGIQKESGVRRAFLAHHSMELAAHPVPAPRRFLPEAEQLLTECSLSHTHIYT